MIDWLIAYQYRERLSDGAMAERLGLGRAYWNQVKNGRLKIGPRALQRIVRHFPQLADLAVEYAADAAW